MEENTEIQLSNWLEEHTDPPNNPAPGWKGNLVGNFVPKIYQAYCKVLQPMYVDQNVTDRSLMWTTDNEAFARGERIFYRELARYYKLRYTKELSVNTILQACGQNFPRYLSGVDEGTIDEESCRRIVSVLRSSAGQPCFFYYDFLKTPDLSIENNYMGKLFTGQLEEVLLLYTDARVKGSPSYWWPADKSWCVWTDYDLTFTIIGGPQMLIDAFVADDFLECIKVDVTTRIDRYADYGNTSM